MNFLSEKTVLCDAVVVLHQEISPHVAVAEIAVPVDCWRKLLNSLDLSKQLSHLTTTIFISSLSFPVFGF